MFEQLFAISRNTFLESIRQPLFTVLILVGALVLVLNPQLAAYTLEDDNKLMIDMGLSTIFVVGLFLAAFTATGVLAQEVENQTAQTVLSKPVSRPVFVVGKYLGVAGAIGLAFWILGILFLLTVRHRVMQTASDQIDQPVVIFGALVWLAAAVGAGLGNYLFRWVFSSSFAMSLAGLQSLALVLVLLVGRDWQFQSPAVEFGAEGMFLQGQMLLVMAALLEGLLVLCALAIVCSTRLGQIMTVLICVTLFLLGLASQTLLGWAVEPNAAGGQGIVTTAAVGLVRIFYWVLPNLQFLWLTDALTRGLELPVWHLGALSLYCLAQIAALLAVAVALFQSRQVG